MSPPAAAVFTGAPKTFLTPSYDGCDCCKKFVIGTGILQVDPATGAATSAVPPGGPDGSWFVGSTLPGPAVAASPSGGWVAAPLGHAWITPPADGLVEVATTYLYETSFFVDPIYLDYQVSIAVAASDDARIYAVDQPPSTGAAPLYTHSGAGSVQTFAWWNTGPGWHTLYIEVDNAVPGDNGLLVYGTVGMHIAPELEPATTPAHGAAHFADASTHRSLDSVAEIAPLP